MATINMNNIVFAQNLQRLMDESKIDRKKLCDDLGFKYSTLSEWLSAKKYPRNPKIDALAAYFNVPRYVLTEKHASQLLSGSEVLIPLIGRCAAGLNCHAEDNIEGYILTDCDKLTEGYEYFWLTVKGDSMEPELHDGDRVLVREQETLDRECYAVVRIDGEDGVVKRVRIDRDRITLTSVNPYYPPRVFEREQMNDIAIVGKVVQSQRNFD